MNSPTNSLAALSLSSAASLAPTSPSNGALKRKRSPLAHPDQSRSPSPSPAASTSASGSALATPASLPQLRNDAKPQPPIESAADTGLIRCICGITQDDGLTVFCELCGFWQHVSCVIPQPPAPVPTAVSSITGADTTMETDDDLTVTQSQAQTHSPTSRKRSLSPSSSRGPPSSSSSTAKPKSKSKTPSGSALLPPSPPPVPELVLPDQWFCERCVPRPVDAVGARERQLARRMAERVGQRRVGSLDNQRRGGTTTATATATSDSHSEMGESTTTDVEEDGLEDLVGPVPGPSSGPNASTNGRRRAASGNGEGSTNGESKRRKSNAADSNPLINTSAPLAGWGAPPPPRRAALAAAAKSASHSHSHSHSHPHSSTSHQPAASSSTSGSTGARKPRTSVSSSSHLQKQPPSGLSKRDEETLFEPWATEYTSIGADVVSDSKVREEIRRWVGVLVGREDEWCPNGETGNGGESISPLTSCIPVQPLSHTPSSSTQPPAQANRKKVRVSVRPVPSAEYNSLPSPTVCPPALVSPSPFSPYSTTASPFSTPISASAFGSASAYPFPSPSSVREGVGVGGGGYSGMNGAGGMASSMGTGYVRPPTYGLYTACPTTREQQQLGLVPSSSSSSLHSLSHSTPSSHLQSTDRDRDGLREKPQPQDAYPYYTPAATIPAGTYLAPFPSCVGSLQSYVTAPSSQYGLLQSAKPFVRLVGRCGFEGAPRSPRASAEQKSEHWTVGDGNDSEETEDDDEVDHTASLDTRTGSDDAEGHCAGLALALDAREMGGEARFARNGCFPNAVIRPVLAYAVSSSIPSSSFKSGSSPKRKSSKNGTGEVTLSWALYSTRPIAAKGEEIVLGWEWDRRSAVHRLKRIIRDGCSGVDDENDIRTQLSQILYTLGGTFTSCACVNLNSGSNHGSMSGSGQSVPTTMRECVFVMMARFVAERSRFIGKPDAGLSISFPVSNSSMSGPQRFMNGYTSSSSSPIFPGGSSSSSTNRKTGLSRTSSSNTPLSVLPKLNLDAAAMDFDQFRLNVDMGPMVGWPDDEDERDRHNRLEIRQSGRKTVLGVGAGVSALPLPPMYGSGPRALLRFVGPAPHPRNTSPSSTASISMGVDRLERPRTPPPSKPSFDGTAPLKMSQSHSAPPHFTNTNSLMLRAAVAATAGNGSPLGTASVVAHVGVAPSPPKRGWAEVVGLYDRPVSPSPAPSQPKPVYTIPPSVGKSSSRGASTSTLPRIKTSVDALNVPSLKVHPPTATASSTFGARKTSSVVSSPSSAPLSAASAAFAASLSSSLGLEMELDDEVDADTAMDVDADPDVSVNSDTSVSAHADSSVGLSEEPNGEDGSSPVKLPPWARKRVRSASSLASFAPPPAVTSSSLGVSVSLPAVTYMHHALASANSIPVIVDEAMDTSDEMVVPANDTVSNTAETKLPLTSSPPLVDPAIMPPPPIPAALDPTTVTSISVPSSPAAEHGAALSPAKSLSPSLVPVASSPPRAMAPLPEPCVASSEPLITSESTPATIELKVTPQEVAIPPASSSTTTPPQPPPPPARRSFADWVKQRKAAVETESGNSTTSTISESSAHQPSPTGVKVEEAQHTPASPPTLLGVTRSIVDDTKQTDVKAEASAPLDVSNAASSKTDLDEAPMDATEVAEIVPQTPDELPTSASAWHEALGPIPGATPVALESDTATPSLSPPAPHVSSSMEHSPDSSRSPEPVAPELPNAPLDMSMEMDVDEDVKPIISTPPPAMKEPHASISTLPAPSVVIEDAEDGEILDSPAEISLTSPQHAAPVAVLGANEERQSRSSTPASTSSRPTPPPRSTLSPRYPPVSPSMRERERLGSTSSGPNGVRPSSYTPGSPADSHSSSVSDRDRDDYRYRDAPPPGMYNGNLYSRGGHSPYARRGTGPSGGDRYYTQRRSSPPPMRDRDLDRRGRNSSMDNHRNSNGWGRTNRGFAPRGGFSDRRPSSPSAVLQPRESNAADAVSKQRAIDERARAAEAYKARSAPGHPPTTYGRSDS